MAADRALTFRRLDEDATVRAILEGTATETGERFFAALVENLSKALQTYSAWVSEYIAESRQLRDLAFWVDGQLFGKERLREIIRKNARRSADQIIDAVYNELNSFKPGLKLDDDITLVVIKLKELPGAVDDWQI